MAVHGFDSTVLCTGENSTKEFQGVSEVSSLLEADLFLFQYTPPGSQRFGGISNWFISAYSNNKVLMTMREILMDYWRDYDCTLDYYIFHLFFGGMVRAYPEEINAMPYAYSVDALQLMKHWHERYDQEKWNKWTSKACFHKLSSRPVESLLNNKGNIYHRIINN